jgi:2-keto-3-deoxy-L-rhamnonate aldolase RhmA
VFQVESPLAVENAAEIVSDGVDVLFVGPTDLSHAMGILGLRRAGARPALRTVSAATEHAGKAAAILRTAATPRY